MPPPGKKAQMSRIDAHAFFAPWGTPMSFVKPHTICCSIGGNICLWDYKENVREFVPSPCYSVTRFCGNASQGLVAFSEGGTAPKVYVYGVDPVKMLYTLSDTCELELADMAFSRCGARLYTLAKATKNRLRVFSTVSGQPLPGCDLELPTRFDKVAPNPGDKDTVALVQMANVRIVNIRRSFETYITKLQQPSLISETADISISAYEWTSKNHFLVATRQGLLCTIDGATGELLYVANAERTITAILVTSLGLCTAHAGNVMRYWSYDPSLLPTTRYEGSLTAQGVPPMEPSTHGSSGGRASKNNNLSPYKLKKVSDVAAQMGRVDAEEDAQGQNRLLGQILQVEPSPEYKDALVVTSEGELWQYSLPSTEEVAAELSKADEDHEEEDEHEEREIEELELDLRLLTWFHTQIVTDVCFLGSSSVCASVDEGGLLRLWDAVEGAGAVGFSIGFSSALTSVASSGRGALLLVGAESGVVRVIDTSDWRRAKTVSAVRLCEEGIAQLRAVQTRERGRGFHCAAATLDHRICIFMVLAEGDLRVQGFVDIGGGVEDISFLTSGSASVERPRLLVAGNFHHVGSGERWPCVWAIEAPEESYEPREKDLPRDVCGIWSMKLAEQVTAVGSFGDNVILGFGDGSVRSYPMPSMASMPSLKHAVGQPLKTLFNHAQLVSAVQVSPDGFLCSASMDGSVQGTAIEGATRRAPSFHKYLHSPYQGGVLCMRLARDASAVVSSGGSDGVICWSSPGGEPFGVAGGIDADITMMKHLQTGFAEDERQMPIWAPEASAAEEAEAGDESVAQTNETGDDDSAISAESHRKALLLEVEAVRKKLRALVDANQHCPEIERLDRHEFCIDFEERDRIAAKTQERCNALRAQIQKENLARQLIRERLVEEFWKTMRTPGSSIYSLVSSSFSVANYPERIQSEEEQTRLKKLRFLRELELEEKAWLSGKDGSVVPPQLGSDALLDSLEFASGEEEYVVNWWPAKDKTEKQPSAAEGESAPKRSPRRGEKEDMKSKDSMRDLLYEPFELVTNSRRRFQIQLLQQLAAEYRAEFNELFDACREQKMHVADQITERVTRIRAILKELSIEEEVPVPERHPYEMAESVLEVKDAEVKVEKWISAEEKARIEQERSKEEERLRKLRENDAGQRALQQMMGGTLKTKKDLSALEIKLEREEWMDTIPEDQMTEAQLAALAEFKQKEANLFEEQEKYRKVLDTELKKLRQEVQDLMSQFDESLKELHHQRYHHDMKFYCQELYCVRLQLGLLQNLEDNHIDTRLRDEREEARRTKERAEKRLEEFWQKVRVQERALEDRQRRERELLGGFKAQFAQSGLEPEVVAALSRLFRQRRGPKREEQQMGAVGSSVGAGSPTMRGERGSVSSQFGLRQSVLVPGGSLAESGLGRLDPYAATSYEDSYVDLTVESAIAGGAGSEALELEQQEPLRFPDDCPEGCDEANFRKAVDLRKERLMAEAEVAKASAVVTEMQGLLAHFRKSSEDATQEYERLKLEKTRHEKLMEQELYDIEILFKLKQGQVEVPQAAVVTDYSDAIVVDKEVVEARNRRILELGKEKVSTLNTIKEFRKKINLMEWEHKMLALQTQDLEERTKDVHMLRVTKGLQSLLRGGEESRNKADADLLERKIEHLSSTTQQKEGALRRQFQGAQRISRGKRAENSMLERKLRELQQNVIQREHIRRLRAPTGGSGSSGGPQGGGKAGEKRRVVGGGGRIEENEAEIRGAQQQFREARGRRNLLDTAKRHTEEIDLLRKELDRLRQKTFPSFVQLHEAQPANPDF